MAETDYLTLTQALELLKVKPSTLYSYVSRGEVRRIAQEDARRSLYAKVDVQRLASRKRGPLAGAAAAASTMRWGEPVVQTGITCISRQGPIYRNRAAIDLARSDTTFETVAQLMFTGLWREDRAAWPAVSIPADMRALLGRRDAVTGADDIGNLLAMVTLALGMHGRGAVEMDEGQGVAAARLVILTLSGCMGFLSSSKRFIQRRPDESIAAYVLRSAGVAASPQAQRAINGAMIVLADHELAAATLTARVAASTNASLFNCIAAAISCHVGFTVGTASNAVDTQVLDEIVRKKAIKARDLVRDYGDNRLGFNHPLYPDGDPRAEFILETSQALVPRKHPLSHVFPFLEAARRSGAKPGVAFALAVLTRALGMPAGSAAALWILARSAGWVAHVLEQRSQAFMMRPRARYIV